MKRGLAIFDFDGTITRHDTFILFARSAVGNKRFALALLRVLPYIILFKIRAINGGRTKQELFRHLFAGTRQDAFLKQCVKFKNVINSDLSPEVFSRLKEHQRRGDKTIIVTASPAAWVRPWAEENGIDQVIGTELEVSDGILTGSFATKNCHGKEKVNRLKIATPSLDDYEKWAYGDSTGDKFILAIADHSYYICRNRKKSVTLRSVNL